MLTKEEPTKEEQEKITREMPHVVTEKRRQLVCELYAAGVPQERVAYHLGISQDTLVKHYREDLDLNVDQMMSKVAKSLYRDALSGDKQAREFWLRTRGKWYAARAPEDDKKTVVETLLERVIDKL